MANMLARFVKRMMPATEKGLSPADSRGGWWPVVREYFPGAFQRNIEVTLEDSLQYWAVFRCVQLIASDIAKMHIRLVERAENGLWSETSAFANYARVLKKPNHYENRIQFFTAWMNSKLTRGNTYVLKERDGTGVVKALYILDPHRTRPMISDDGSVFYELRRDDLSGVDLETVLVPASEIIHDRWNCLYHPLVGLSPIYAVGLQSLKALRIEKNSAVLFENGARPSGILTAPGAISEATAERMKAYWEENYNGTNVGKVAVLGDALKFETMTMTSVDAQLIEQLKWSDTTIAGAFGVPAYKINAGGAPTYNNVEALDQQYYTGALQIHIEEIELLLDEGLELTTITGRTVGTEFDLSDLLRMDTATKIKTLMEGLKGLYTPNEARRQLQLPALSGGDTVWLQQQNWPMDILADRELPDANPPAPEPAEANPPEDDTSEEDGVKFMHLFETQLKEMAYGL